MDDIRKLNTYRDIIASEFSRRQRRNRRYSLRAYARDLDVAPSTLSEILQGDYGLSSGTAIKIAENLGLRADEREYFCDLVDAQCGPSEMQRQAATVRLRRYQEQAPVKFIKNDTFHLISEWYHLAILDLMSFESFRADPEWIGRHLKISPQVAKDALDRLQRAEVIKSQGDRLVCDVEAFQVAAKAPCQGARDLHADALEMAKQAICEQKPCERDFNTTFVAVNDEDLEYVACRLRELHNELMLRLARHPKKNKLYVISSQFFKICEEENP